MKNFVVETGTTKYIYLDLNDNDFDTEEEAHKSNKNIISDEILYFIINNDINGLIQWIKDNQEKLEYIKTIKS